MNKSAGLVGLLVVLALAGCASSVSKPPAADTLARIDGELGRAAASVQGEATQGRARDSLLPALAVDLPKAAAEAVEPRFDLVVSKAPAGQVFMAIVANTPYSMMVPQDLSGSISVSLKNVTVREALESIREIYGYDFKITGQRVQVQSNAMQMRVFPVNYLAGKRSGSSDLRVTASSISAQGGSSASGSTSATGGAPTSSSGAGTRPSDVSRVSMSSESDFWSELKASLMSIVGSDGGRQVILNPMSGVVLVRGMPQDIRNVEQYLRATQLIVERQVMLEAKIIDVGLSEGFQSGVNWAAFGGSKTRVGIGVAQPGAALATSGAIGVGTAQSVQPGRGGDLSAGSTGSGFLGLSVQSDNFSSLIQFLETQGNVQVLSSPRIATLNNQKAVLKVGSDEYYVTNITTTSTTGTAGTTTSPTISLQPFFSGISLDVTPQIDEHNNIILHVHPSVSVVAEKQKVIDLGTLGNFVLPLAASDINETDSIVRVRDGNIVAIGGLMTQAQSNGRTQVPGLGDIPLAGGLFGQRAKALQKRELVILIKPTIIQNETSWAQDLTDTQSRIREYSPPPKRDAAAGDGK